MRALTGVLAGEAAVASTPDTGARLMVWVKAEDLADRHESGARIAVWPDASGNGHDLKATGDNRPALKLLTDIDEQEDRWAVGFSGTGSFFSMPLAGEWRGVTIFAAGKSLAKPGLFETAPARDGCLRHYGFVQSCGNKAAFNNPFSVIRESTGMAVVCIAAGVDEDGVFTLATPVLFLFAVAIGVCLLNDRRRAKRAPAYLETGDGEASAL